MKAVILAGGLGTRLSEETAVRPKPMVEIGGRPILWHILKMYSHHGIDEFIICCGYKGYMIKEYFANYFLHMSDVTFDMKQNRMEVHQSVAEPWKVTLVDTGDQTGTGGRLKKIAGFVEDTKVMGEGMEGCNPIHLIPDPGPLSSAARFYRAGNLLFSQPLPTPQSLGMWDSAKLLTQDVVVEIAELKLVGAAGIEPATPRLEIWCSIQLSYAPLSKIYHSDFFARLFTLFPAN